MRDKCFTPRKVHPRRHGRRRPAIHVFSGISNDMDDGAEPHHDDEARTVLDTIHLLRIELLAFR